MKKLLIILSVAAMVFTGCKQESNDAIKVACNLPMTGYIGYYGEWIQHGLEMGRADIEAEANELGIKFDFDYQDNKGETKDAITIFQKQSMANPDVYMSGITTQTMSILDQIHKKGLLQVMWSWTPLELDANQNDFRCWVNYGIEGKHIAEYLLSKTPQKVAYLHLDILGAKVQCDDVVVPALKKQNPNINIYIEEFPVETSNFRDIATKVKNFDADVIMVSGFKEHILNIIKDFQAYNIDKKKVLCSMDLLDALEEASNEVLEDLHVTAPAFNIESLQSEKTKAWIEKFVKGNGKQPTYTEAYGYDAMMMLFEAAKIGKKENVSLTEALKKVDVEGVTGQLKFDENGELKDNLHVGVFHNGILKLN